MIQSREVLQTISKTEIIQVDVMRLVVRTVEQNEICL